MDATQALKDAENALRDFIVLLLSNGGADWLARCGVSSDRVEKWKERKAIEARRQEAGVIEERLIYFADFYDLKTILKKNWASDFSAALGDWKTFEIYLGELEKLRDADAHRRELLPHQKHLILGISGEIRNRIVRYRSKMETPDDCFPRIESVRDSLGNLWVPSMENATLKAVNTTTSLRPGDVVDFVATATDPEDLQLQYAVAVVHEVPAEWQNGSTLRFIIGESHIGRTFGLQVSIRSPRPYHANGSRDDSVIFFYNVLPRKSGGN